MEKRIVVAFRLGFKLGSKENSNECVTLEESTGRLAEACLRFTPRVGLRRGGSGLFLDLRTDGEFSPDSVQRRVLVLAERLGLRVESSGQGRSAREAWSRASLGLAPSVSPQGFPLQVLEFWADPFGTREEEDPLALRPIRLALPDLKKLGLQSVEEFLRIPARALTERFGKAVTRLSAEFWFDVPWPRFEPEPRVIERKQVDDEVILGGLVFVLKHLSERALTRLRGRGLRASRVALELKQERWSSVREPLRKIDFVLPMPQGAVSGLLPLLHEKLDQELQIRPLESPLQEIALEITESLPGLGSQRDFFNRREEQKEAWNALLGRLLQKLGRERVFQAKPEARYLPERAWSKVSSVDLPVNRGDPLHSSVHSPVHSPPLLLRTGDLGLPLRPARMLKRPEPVERLSNGMVVALMSGNRWESTSWEGPERISGEWWRDPSGVGFDRDYYRVRTVTGERLWVFINRKAKAGFKAGTYFLHGYFD